MEEILNTNDNLKGKKFLKISLIILLCTSLINIALIYSFFKILLLV